MGNEVQQRIIENLEHLDSFQLSEVYEFVETLQKKRRMKMPDPKMIDQLCGKYQEHLSTSSKFTKRKQQEIEVEEAKWQTT